MHTRNKSLSFDIVLIKGEVHITEREYDKLLFRFNEDFNKIKTYIDTHPICPTNNQEIMKILAEIGCSDHDGVHLCQAFLSYWQSLNKFVPRLNIRKNRIFCLYTLKDDYHVHICGLGKKRFKLILPQEFFSVTIMQSDYACIDRTTDLKGKVKYIMTLPCIHIKANTILELAKWLEYYIKHKSVNKDVHICDNLTQ